MQLLGLGDSMTRGYGASAGRSYFQQLQQQLPAHLPQMQAAVNLAVDGTTSVQHLQDQLPRVQSYHRSIFGLVVASSGGNDLLHSYGQRPPREGAAYGATLAQARPWAAVFQKRLESIRAGLQTRFPGGFHWFLANIYDPTDGQGDIQNMGLPLPPWPDGVRVVQLYNDTLARFAAAHPEQVTLLDIHAAFLGHGAHHGSAPYFYDPNIEDPNDAGYDCLTELFRTAIALQTSSATSF